MDAADDASGAETEAMATVKVADSDEARQSASSLSAHVSSSNPDFTLSGLKSRLTQNLAKKPKAPSGPLPPVAPHPCPLLCHTFLTSPILASKFTQDRCYSNKAWAKLSGLPPCEIDRYERALGDALEWVGKTPTPASSTSPNRSVVRSNSDGELSISSRQGTHGTNPSFSTPPPRNLLPNAKGAGLGACLPSQLRGIVKTR